MKKKTTSLFLISILAISFFGVTLLSFAALSRSASAPLPEPMLLGPDFYEKDVDLYLDPSETLLSDSAAPSASSTEGDVMFWMMYDDVKGGIYAVYYQLYYVGDYCEVWVQEDLGYYNLDGTPQEGRDADTISKDQAAYMGQEFDENIYPIDINYFGEPEFLDGDTAAFAGWGLGNYYDPEGKTAILLSNIRDEYFYDPETPLFIAGFYWGSNTEYYFDRNVMTIDTLAWDILVGTGPTYEDFKDQSRFVFEATFTHEFQHLIHDDYNPGDDTFMNEGCSTFAELICGYPADWYNIQDFFQTPDNSLLLWGDHGGHAILADYGQVQLWTTFLSDHYGSELISNFVQNGFPGVYGINYALWELGFSDRFEDVFRNWKITNLIHTGMYDYTTIDLDWAIEMGLIDPIRTYDLEARQHPWKTGTSFGTTINPTAGDTGVSVLSPFSTDYIKLENLKGANKILFDGDDTVLYGWQEVGKLGWWSDSQDYMDTSMYAEAYVDPSDPYLELVTYWHIEDYWDFGFVQVYDGMTWVSLANEYVVYEIDPDANPAYHPWNEMLENMPGLTGWSGDFIEMSFDLSDYAGQTAQFRFRYMTDWYTTYEGWYISEAEVSGTDLEFQAVYPPANFEVILIEEYIHNNGDITYAVHNTMMLDLENFGYDCVYVDKKLKNVYISISLNTYYGTADYKFSYEKQQYEAFL